MSTRIPLTTRQRQVLEILVRGGTNRAIAAELGISPHTVKHQLGALMRKTGARNRTEVALFWVQHGPETVGAEASFGTRVQDLVVVRAGRSERTTPEERFWACVKRHEDGPQSDCWDWEGPIVWSGAGIRPSCYVRGLEHLGRSARRIAYMLVHGVLLPPEVRVVPACPRHNRRCVNPAHLRLGGRGEAPEWRHWKSG